MTCKTQEPAAHKYSRMMTCLSTQMTITEWHTQEALVLGSFTAEHISSSSLAPGVPGQQEWLHRTRSSILSVIQQKQPCHSLTMFQLFSVSFSNWLYVIH